MLLVILGAGASYDSAPSYPPPGPKDITGQAREPRSRPPLADHLFDDRPNFRTIFNRFPESLALITHLRHRQGGATVERELDNFLGEATAYPARHSQLMAVRYCLHLLLYGCIQEWEEVHGGVTNYSTLMDHIARWSANYDRVIVATSTTTR